MQIKEFYKNSQTKRLLDFLFLTKKDEVFIETKIGFLAKQITLPFVGEILLVLATLLFWFEPIFTRFGVPTMAASALLFLSFLVIKKDNMKIKRTNYWILLFYIALLVSGIFSILFLGLPSKLILLGFLLFLQFGIAIFIGQTFPDKDVINKFLIFLSLPLIILGFYQFLIALPTPSTWVAPGEVLKTRAYAFFGSPNILGALLAIISILSVSYYLKEKNKYYLVVSGFAVAVVIFTFSRSAWLGLIAGFFFGAIFYNYKYLSVLLLSPLVLFVSAIRNRILNAIRPEYFIDSTLDGRIWSFINGIHIFISHIFLGTGPGSYGGELAINYTSPIYLESIQNGYTALYYTDNEWLQLLVQSGILGFLSFIFIVFSAIYELVISFFKTKDIIKLSVSACFVCFSVMGLFANVLEYGAIVVPMGLILGAAINE